MEFIGDISVRRPSIYVDMLLPFITIKKGIERVFRFFQNLIWSELIRQATPKAPDFVQELIDIFTFGIFCLLCLVSYRFHNYYPTIVLFLGGCWYLDITLSLRNFRQKIPLRLTFTKDNYCLWKLGSAEPKRIHRQNLVGIGIGRAKILSGAFESVIAQPWQVFLEYNQRSGEDKINLIVFEEVLLTSALAKARKLAEFLALPVDFLAAESVNSSTKAEKRINYQVCDEQNYAKFKPGAINIKKTPRQWHIFSHWTDANSGYFFGKVINESGFLLFAIILREFMSRFGQLVDVVILSVFRRQTIVYFDFDDFAFNNIFSWLRVLELLVATGIMIWRGIQISQIKHFYIDAEHFRFGINRKITTQMDLAAITDVVLFLRPEPLLLILDEVEALEIKNLLTPSDYQGLFLAINDCLEHFKPESKPQESKLKELKLQ